MEMTETVLFPLLTTYASLLDGLYAIPIGKTLTGILLITLLVAPLITVTSLDSAFVTYSLLLGGT